MVSIKTDSYLRTAAKLLLLSALQKVEDNSMDYCEFQGLKWRKNYGVVVNFEFYDSDSEYYFESSSGLFEPKYRNPNGDPMEWFDPMFDRGKLLFTVDFAIFHKGLPAIMIHVVEPNYLMADKAEVIQNVMGEGWVQLYQVSATNILLCKDELVNIEFLKWNI